MGDVDVRRMLVRFGIEVERVTGPELWALCPSHKDSRPSWSINLHTGLHSCFSCEFGGNAADLALHQLGAADLAWTRADAWRWLESQGLMVDQTPIGLSVQLCLARGRPAKGFAMPLGVVQAPLDRWPTPALRYARERGITDEQVRRWQLGYAVDGKLGGRIVFPFYNVQGHLQSYSARTFAGHHQRYITPSKEERPVDGAMFGELRWPGVWERKVLAVTEGAVDALAVERATGLHVAGIPGVKRSRSLRTLAKLATWPEIVLLTDPDEAGDWAAEELRTALGRHSKVRRGLLPDGRDAAECTPAEICRAVA